MDAIAGRYTSLWFEPKTIEDSEIRCEPACALGKLDAKTSSELDFNTVLSVLSTAAFESWLASSTTSERRITPN